MKKVTVKILSVITVIALFISCFVLSVSAQNGTFDENAYTTIITASDFQSDWTDAYSRFGNIVSVMKNDGMQTPDTMLMGGDFTMILCDYANPGITLIERKLTEVYPDFNENSVVCIQGNHDNTASGLAKTGFYDMGTYCLYCINENDFPWKQNSKLNEDKKIKSLADDIETELNNMIDNNDLRPVIFMTHVPLHHTTRSNGGDNLYSSYIFNVINKAAEKLDIIFMYGHNHSSHYDDYIGGSVNFLTTGDTIRIPVIEDSETYTEETLNFTYTNCGYVGYSKNSVSETSTNVLTVGSIQLCDDTIKFTKYSEDGLYASYEIERVAPLTTSAGETTVKFDIQNEFWWNIAKTFFTYIFNMFDSLHIPY